MRSSSVTKIISVNNSSKKGNEMDKLCQCLDIAERAQAEAALIAHKIKKGVHLLKDKENGYTIALNTLDDSAAALLGDSDGLVNFEVQNYYTDFRTRIGVCIARIAGRSAVHILVKSDCYKAKKKFNKRFLKRVPKAKLSKMKEPDSDIVYRAFSFQRALNIDNIVKAIIQASCIVRHIMNDHFEHLLKNNVENERQNASIG